MTPVMPTPMMNSTSVKAARPRLVDVALHSILRKVSGHFQRLTGGFVRPSQAHGDSSHIVAVTRMDRRVGDKRRSVIKQSAVRVRAGGRWKKRGRKSGGDEAVGIDLFPAIHAHDFHLLQADLR